MKNTCSLGPSADSFRTTEISCIFCSMSKERKKVSNTGPRQNLSGCRKIFPLLLHTMSLITYADFSRWIIFDDVFFSCRLYISRRCSHTWCWPYSWSEAPPCLAPSKAWSSTWRRTSRASRTRVFGRTPRRRSSIRSASVQVVSLPCRRTASSTTIVSGNHSDRYTHTILLSLSQDRKWLVN